LLRYPIATLAMVANTRATFHFLNAARTVWQDLEAAKTS
jgi:hypothetical protein